MHNQLEMGDIELTFDEVFGASRQSSPQHLPNNRLLHSKLPLTDSMSSTFPKPPNPTTTATPVMAPAVVKAPWNYSETLEEAFPDAEFSYPEFDEAMTLADWLHLNDFESPSEDYRLAALIRDELPYQEETEEDEQYLMSGALPNDGEVVMTKVEVETIAVKDESKDEVKHETQAESKDEGFGKGKGKAESKEKLSFLSDQDSSDEDSEDDDYGSDDFDETPYGTGFGGGWL